MSENPESPEDIVVGSTEWNLADLFEALVRDDPTAPAQAYVRRVPPDDQTSGGHAVRRFDYRAMDKRANALARYLVERGCTRQGKVAQYLWNGPEYMESVFGCFKASLVPVNTNYRYVESELVYLWDNADAEAVIFHSSLAKRAALVRRKVPGVSVWIQVDDDGSPCPEWAVPYEDVVGGGVDAFSPPWKRDGDDLWILYTGGTTGMPKGVMWRHDDLWRIMNAGRLEPFDLTGGLVGLENQYEAKLTRPVQLPACPLMHGTGFLTALGALLGGGSVVTLGERSYRPEFVLDVIEQEKVQAMAIVGDAFGRPMVEALDAEPGRWDITSLLSVVSSGVMWSEEVKRGMLRHHPEVVLADGLGSSEAIGMGKSESTGEAAAGTASFTLGDRACVLTEDGRRVRPGSGERGRVAIFGYLPVGYYKDPEKTAATFPTYDGVRYSIPGDWATIEADGSIQLLGRGSVCINTGGEKVFPEEVEEVLKRHELVRDAVCVGVPHPRFGQMVTAVVEADVEPEAAPPPEAAERIAAWVRSELAPYKAPRRILFRPVGRAANGKADYNGLREWATEEIGPVGS